MRSGRHISAILSAAAALLLISSCVKIRTDRPAMSDTELTLRTFSLPSTKAVTGLENFGLYAFYTSLPEETNFLNTRTSEDPVIYIKNGYFAPIASSSTYGGFDPSDHSTAKPYYYPLTGSLLFYGYSPYKEAGGIITGDITYSASMSLSPYLIIPVTQKTDPSQMVDLLYFDILSLNGGKTIGKQASPVAAEFKHAMSKLSFKFKDTNSQYKVTATLRNCLNQATFYLSHDTGWEADYSTPAKRADYTIANGLQLNSSLSETTTLYIIPQYAASADMTLSLEITDGFGTQVVEMKMADYVELYERGKHYIYNITRDSGRIEFAPPVIEDMDQIEQKI